MQERKREKLRKLQKTPHINEGKGGHLGRKAPSREKKKWSVRVKRVVGRQASRPLLITLKVRSMLKRMSGVHKLLSIVHRMSM